MLLVMGDFNVWADIEDDGNAQNLSTLMNTYGLNQIIHEPTHTGGHTLDHVYMNEYELEIELEVLSETFGLVTDHYPIKITIPSPTSQNIHEVITFRKLKDVNLEVFKEDLKEVYNIMDFTNLNFKDCYTMYDEASRKVVDKHCPLVTERGGLLRLLGLMQNIEQIEQ